jgi:hypothetical protein
LEPSPKSLALSFSPWIERRDLSVGETTDACQRFPDE